jgi:hypothetical protein
LFHSIHELGQKSLGVVILKGPPPLRLNSCLFHSHKTSLISTSLLHLSRIQSKLQPQFIQSRVQLKLQPRIFQSRIQLRIQPRIQFRVYQICLRGVLYLPVPLTPSPPPPPVCIYVILLVKVDKNICHVTQRRGGGGGRRNVTKCHIMEGGGGGSKKC